ncbi:MAG TPA: CpsD/CapB family tyrosine-protein kinase, partial [Chloroflexota bacterium]|nr:CpsD/CapB family tyrosine-protein kinase [Chloroflexota bacterium]
SLLPLEQAGRAPGVYEPAREWLLTDMDELYRGIYTRTGTGTAEVLAICSAVAGEGKTTTCLGLAVTIAQDFPERRVLLVEADLARPVLANDFGLEPIPGLADCIMTGEPLHAAYRATLLDNLHLVPAGGPVNAGRVLRSTRMASLVDTMRESYDIVILDTAALLGNSDSLLLTDLADGVIFVVRANVTPAHLVQKAIEQLDDGKLRGVVLNGTRSAVPGWLRRLGGF